jgi:hypothetical protein
MTISISDLSPVTSDSLLASIDREEGGVIKSAVARALAAREVVGGTSASITKVDPAILVKPIKPPLIAGKIPPTPYPPCPPPIVTGKIACPPIVVGLIAVDPSTVKAPLA